MKSIIITGSTRGFGFGLAQAFLDLGCRVAISGRTQSAVDNALERLLSDYPAERVTGQPCDVTDYEHLENLWSSARSNFAEIDIWINNAGIAHPLMEVREMDRQLVARVLQTNLLGAIYGSQVALKGMLAQGHGSIYITSGHGGNGRKQDGLSVYGTSKAGLHYFTESLIIETKRTSILVGELRPGMIVTDLLTDQFEHRPERWEDAKRIFNILADRVETVAPWMANEILNNTKHGAILNWYRRGKIFGRFLTAPFHQRKIID
jgi:NAD(P)-dependent dehydrogenase (short-subunit alcohol dehydrogenase family)